LPVGKARGGEKPPKMVLCGKIITFGKMGGTSYNNLQGEKRGTGVECGGNERGVPRPSWKIYI